MRIDWMVGTMTLKEPQWTITEQEVGRWWWKRKVYAATNGIIEVAGLDAGQAHYLLVQNKVSSIREQHQERI